MYSYRNCVKYVQGHANSNPPSLPRSIGCFSAPAVFPSIQVVGISPTSLPLLPRDAWFF